MSDWFSTRTSKPSRFARMSKFRVSANHYFLEQTRNNTLTLLSDTVIYTVHNRTFSWGSWWGIGPVTEFAPSSTDHDQVASRMPKIEALVNSGKVKPNPVKFWPGGLEAVSEGLQYMREGKVSGEKIVYRV